jgi:hypothetical protein
MAMYPSASLNAWQRMLLPWRSIPATFTVPKLCPIDLSFLTEKPIRSP